MAVLRSVVNYELQITNYESFTILGLSLLRYCQATDKKAYMYNRRLGRGYLPSGIHSITVEPWVDSKVQFPMSTLSFDGL